MKSGNTLIKALTSLTIMGILTLCFACSKSDEFQACETSSLISLENNICLSFEHTQLSDPYKEKIQTKMTEGIADITHLMPINNLQIRVVNNPNYVIPEIGMGGFNPNPNEVILSINAGYPDLDNVLETYLIPLLAHEVHHAKRRRSVGYGNTLLQAIVSEGLADHFSMEVSGIDPPPWSIALTDKQLQEWIEEASKSWHQSYNHRDWFGGANPNIPRWTGYSIGFYLVSNYLAKNPNKSASELHNEPARSFEPQ